MGINRTRLVTEVVCRNRYCDCEVAMIYMTPEGSLGEESPLPKEWHCPVCGRAAEAIYRGTSSFFSPMTKKKQLAQ